ncbi:MAG: GNAT family N-acetyltransferase [Paludibacteraceae bacterium]|nr:GNAT family N-acetyltransferase [Paludibacteraceae bacterium]
MEEKIIDPVEVAVIEEELRGHLLRKSNKAGNEIYVFDGLECPNAMREVGRLREVAFRTSGGGSGLNCDVDQYDYLPSHPYKQLVVWNPDEKEIVGGYRYIHGRDVQFDSEGVPMLTSAHLFGYSEKFLKEYLPYTIELGRSFIRPEYQSTKRGTKSLFALDNLWDGLGALMVSVPDTRYFFGKATIYPSYGIEACQLLFYFLRKYFGDTENLVYPHRPMPIPNDDERLSKVFTGKNYKEDYVILKEEAKKLGRTIPPLVNAYMSLSPTMRIFGTSVNDEFGDVWETGLIVKIADIFEDKKARHVNTYERDLSPDERL